MATCTLCGLDSGGFSKHYECARMEEVGKSAEAIRAVQLRQRLDSDIKAMQSPVVLAGVLIALYAIVGAVVGYNVSHESMESLVYAMLGLVAGLLIGTANLLRVRMQSIAAKRIVEYVTPKE